MNNSLPRLIDGMIATLRGEIIPHVEGDFARGQAFGLIYMLNSIRLRAAWSNEFLCEQLQALDEASRDLEGVMTDLPGAPALTLRAPSGLPTAVELESMRDQGAARVCELIDWLATHRAGAPAVAVARAEDIIDRYIHRQLKWELSTSAKPMFDEISRGSEKGA
ncbi:MAG TPA: hypothetical protein VII20_14880 [Roseiarcus sp.]